MLVGQDLLRAAAVRAQISQIEKYQTAVNTFYGKYNALPADIAETLCEVAGELPWRKLLHRGRGGVGAQALAYQTPEQVHFALARNLPI